MAFTKLFHVVMQMFVPAGAGDNNPRGRLIAYVHGDGHLVQHNEAEGTMPFSEVFVKRPDKCRFAILQTWGGEAPTYTVLDLYDTRYTGVPGGSFVAGAKWVFTTEAEAVACAQMQL